MTFPDVHREFAVDALCQRQLAYGAYRILLRRPRFGLVPVLLIAVWGVLVGLVSGNVAFTVAVATGLLVLFVVRIVVTAEVLSKALVGRGYAPGDVVTADWTADRVVIHSSAGTSIRLIADVAWVHRGGTVTVAKFRTARQIVIWPTALAPADIADRVASLGVRRLPV